MCVNKALLSDGINTVQAKQSVDKYYSGFTTSETTFERSHADFKRDRTDINDAERLAHSNSAVVQKLVLVDRKLKLLEITEELKISVVSVSTIVHEHLSLRKLRSKWVPRLLTVDD